jgi:hypothetical protein
VPSFEWEPPIGPHSLKFEDVGDKRSPFSAIPTTVWTLHPHRSTSRSPSTVDDRLEQFILTSVLRIIVTVVVSRLFHVFLSVRECQFVFITDRNLLKLVVSFVYPGQSFMLRAESGLGNVRPSRSSIFSLPSPIGRRSPAISREFPRMWARTDQQITDTGHDRSD